MGYDDRYASGEVQQSLHDGTMVGSERGREGSYGSRQRGPEGSYPALHQLIAGS